MTATAADAVVIAPAARLRGRLRMPGDKSISHRALLLGGMAVGRSVVTGGSDALDPRSTASCLRALGVSIEDDTDADGQATYQIDSPGLAGWQVPADTLDCGNSGTTLRLLTGILAGQAGGVGLADGPGALARFGAPSEIVVRDGVVHVFDQPEGTGCFRRVDAATGEVFGSHCARVSVVTRKGGSQGYW